MSVQFVRRGDGSLPIYRQISEVLRSEIQNYYKAGDSLPAEFDLAIRFNVNRHTLRRAIDELVNEGLVVRRHGKGVFILTPSIDYQIGTQTRFTENLESVGKTSQSHVIRKQIIPAKGGPASRLKLCDGKEIIFLETLRNVDEKPFCISSHFIPLNNYYEIFDDYSEGSLHEFFFKYYSLNLVRAESFISAVIPEKDDALRLNMSCSLPVLRVKSLNVCAKSKLPIEYVVTRFRGDVTQLAIKP